MKKQKFLLKTYTKHPKGYGILTPPNYERMTWEKMEQELSAEQKYLKHFIEEEWVDTSEKNGVHVCTDKDPHFKKQVDDLQIPLGELRIYLIVYTEEQQENE